MDNHGFEVDDREGGRRQTQRCSDEQTNRHIMSEKRIIYKNVFLLSGSFLLLFVAFESMSKLQSSINVVSSEFIPLMIKSIKASIERKWESAVLFKNTFQTTFPSSDPPKTELKTNLVYY